MRRTLLLLILGLTLHLASGEQWCAGTEVTAEELASYDIDKLFVSEPISDAIFARMWGKSYKKDCTIPRSELRYIKALHITLDGKIKRGEMVVNRVISNDIVTILRELYKAGYPIERMVLVDEYGADDEASMTVNNSSAFNYRTTPGGTRLSAHSRGMAVDINPLYNPYVKVLSDRTIVAPKAAAEYVDRNGPFPYKIERHDICCKLFLEHGFEWGGDYKSIKDYQHFEK